MKIVWNKKYLQCLQYLQCLPYLIFTMFTIFIIFISETNKCELKVVFDWKMKIKKFEKVKVGKFERKM